MKLICKCGKYRLTAVISLPEQFFCLIRPVHYNAFSVTFLIMKYEKVMSKAKSAR
jgi:hypothetical protein